MRFPIISFGKYRPLKLPLSCELVENTWFLGPRFVGGMGIPQISDIFKSQSLPSMSPVLVELHSLRSDSSSISSSIVVERKD